MTAIITQKFRLQQAELFKESSSAADRNLYLFIGRSSPWDNETSPDLPEDTVSQEATHWNDMIALKKITSSNVTYCLPRHDWLANTVYMPYDQDDADLFNHPTPAEIVAAQTGGYNPGGIYVLTDEMNVYLCIDNASGAQSTYKPTGQAVDITQTADGYRWKFLFTLTSSEILKYLTDDWIPVKILSADDGSSQWLVQQAATDGAIEHIRVIASGSLYNRTQIGGIPQGGTAGSNTIVLDSGASGVDDYYNGCSIYLKNNEVGLVTDYVGSSKTATLATNWVLNPTELGNTYDVLPTITITGDGSGAKAKPFVLNGQIKSVDILSKGSSYRVVSVTISDHISGGSGASVKPILGPQGGLGSNLIELLGASFVMMNIKLEYNEGSGDFPIDNDYRKIGIVRDVKLWNTNIISTLSTARACKQLTLENVTSPFEPDEEFTSIVGAETIKGKVIEYVPGSTSGVGYLKYYQDLTTGFGSFSVPNSINGSDSLASATITEVNNPTIEPFSGDIIYIEQRRPVTRSADQTEDIKIISEF